MSQITAQNAIVPVNLYSLLGARSVAEMVRRFTLRWFRHLKRKVVDDWMSACRNVVVTGVKLWWGRGDVREQEQEYFGRVCEK